MSREHSALPTSNSQLCTFGSHSLTDSHYCAAPHSQTHCSVGRMGLRKENTCLFTQLGCEGPHTMPEGLASIPTDRLRPVDREYMAHTGTCSAHFQSFKHVYLPNTSLQLQLPHKERGLQATQGTFISRDPGSHTVTQKVTVVQHRSADSPNKINSVWCQERQWPNKRGKVRSLGKNRQGRRVLGPWSHSWDL